MLRSSGDRLILPAVLLACIGCLQPGIDPVFLTLLSSVHELAPDFHGWIVTATQSGMAIGSLLTWRWGTRIPRDGFVLAAGFAAVAALNRPHGAYGAVFLCQLMLSTGVAIGLPTISTVAGPTMALSALAAAPLGALLLAAFSTRSTAHPQHNPEPDAAQVHENTTLRAWASASATLLFICSTMMIWTFSGALAVKAGISETVIGEAVALGSLAGAATAFFVMRERSIVPPPLTGVLSGLALLSPIAATSTGNAEMFIVAIVLLNIGSTAIIVRTSGLASAASQDSLFRRFVACTHALGMIMGPLTGSLATGLFGDVGLLVAAVLAIMAACLMLLFAESRSLRMRLWTTPREAFQQP